MGRGGNNILYSQTPIQTSLELKNLLELTENSQRETVSQAFQKTFTNLSELFNNHFSSDQIEARINYLTSQLAESETDMNIEQIYSAIKELPITPQYNVLDNSIRTLSSFYLVDDSPVASPRRQAYNLLVNDSSIHQSPELCTYLKQILQPES